MQPESEQTLREALQAADPAAFLVPTRIIRRVILDDREVPAFTLRIPHRKSLTLTKTTLLRTVDAAELGGESGRAVPDHLTLIAEPHPDEFEGASPPHLRAATWRLLYHARVHAVLDARFDAGTLDAHRLRAWIEQIGVPEFAEARSVLSANGMLLPPEDDDRNAFVEFAATFLELHAFAPTSLPRTFPAIRDFDRIFGLLDEEVGAAALLAATRLTGAAEIPLPTGLDASTQPVDVPGPVRPSRAWHDRLCRGAARAARRGNVVRAAILHARAAGYAATEEDRRRGWQRAEAEITELCGRLTSALGVTRHEESAWRDAFEALLDRGKLGLRSAEAKILYDLQKICVDQERSIFTVDVIEWALTLGKRPLKRELPSEQRVLRTRHLNRAAARVGRTRLGHAEQESLAGLLVGAATRAESDLRGEFHPVLAAALDDVGLHPTNFPERVALDKLTEELLDRVVAHGSLRMSDLRDAVSRNQLKLGDIARVGDVFGDDPLLRSDRRLAVTLDGVYRRGEIYLRVLQSLSALVFGTVLGRWCTLHMMMPFFGAFVALEGLQHMVAPALEFFSLPPIHFVNLISTLALGAFLWGVLHAGRFRAAVAAVFRGIWKGIRWLCVELPRRLAAIDIVRWVLDSRPFILAFRFGLKPLAYTAVLWVVLSTGETPILAGWLDALLAFGVVNIVVNSPWGRHTEEIGTEWLGHLVHRFRVQILAGLFRAVVAAFRALLELVDRFFYAVDEWLRFRKGESRLSLIGKACIHPFWFLISYVARLYTNLLVEPQINPIKHFPVVTVAHKIILPFTVILTQWMAAPLTPLGSVVANSIAGTTVLLLPGVFGFLVWELKENWRLFAGNRRTELRPTPVGSHGETLPRLLRPGFHSGTLPKLYGKLRRVTSRRRYKQLRRAVHHVETDVRRFAERELKPYLNECGHPADVKAAVGHVVLATNLIRIAIMCPRIGAPVEMQFVEGDGHLVAELTNTGWIADLDPESRNSVHNALAGFFKSAGVDIVAAGANTTRFDDCPVTWDAWTRAWGPLSDRPTLCQGTIVIPT